MSGQIEHANDFSDEVTARFAERMAPKACSNLTFLLTRGPLVVTNHLQAHER